MEKSFWILIVGTETRLKPVTGTVSEKCFTFPPTVLLPFHMYGFRLTKMLGFQTRNSLLLLLRTGSNWPRRRSQVLARGQVGVHVGLRDAEASLPGRRPLPALALYHRKPLLGFKNLAGVAIDDAAAQKGVMNGWSRKDSCSQPSDYGGIKTETQAAVALHQNKDLDVCLQNVCFWNVPSVIYSTSETMKTWKYQGPSN